MAADARAPLRVVCVSDLHYLWDEGGLNVPAGDVLVVAGDTELPTASAARRFNKWLAEQPHAHKIVGFGNMDSWAESATFNPELLSNATVLLNSATEIGGYTFLASPHTPKFYGAFQLYGEVAAKQHWSKLLPPDTRVDVLITHGPPQGYGDLTRGQHVGDPELLQAVMALETPPLLWVCGHIHSGYGMYELPHPRSGRTITLVNAAMDYARRQPARIRPWVVKLPDVHVNAAPS